MANGRRILIERVTQLDAPYPAVPAETSPIPDLRHFIRTVSRVTRPVDVHRDTLPVIPADEADAIVASCSLIRRLRSEWPEIVAGPLDLGGQYWVSAERPPDQTPRHRQLSVGHFDVPDATRARAASTKPFTFGLFTSSGSSATFGMWWLYLDDYRGSTLFGEPRTPWRVRLAESTRVLEIRSGADWAALVSSFPIEGAGMLYPDWTRIAERWDGVHMTVPAIAATQAVGIALADSATAPTNWDVESTFWLRWTVTSAAPVE